MKDLIRKYLREYIEQTQQNQSQSLGEDSKFKKPRKMSKSYCKKTPCNKMGFSQKASCRPHKNCYN